MKVLVLNGADKSNNAAELVCSILTKKLAKGNHEVNFICLQDVKIANCLGCFSCWLKTPGICVINDPGRELARSVIQSDLVITITPITFGGYSYHLKKAMDRLIPIISPFFLKINGEFHHKPRYERYPVTISIGLLPETNEDMTKTFQNLVARNALNMHNTSHLCGILLNNQTETELGLEITKLLTKAVP